MFVSPSDLQDHQNDYDWLDEHIDPVYLQVRQGLMYAYSAQEAIEVLNLIMPYALTRHDYNRWVELLYDALLYCMDLKDEEIQIQVWAHLGNCLFQQGKPESASVTLEKALRGSPLDVTPAIMLRARIGMLRTKTIYAINDIREFIAETLKVARQIADYHLLGKLHYTLAVAYNHQGKTREAMGYAQMALAYWYRENNDSEKERAALALAEICRVATRYEQAARYLELVRPGAEYSYTSGAYHYHQGSVLLQQNQFAEALEHLEEALEQFETLDFPYLTGAAYHSLALVQTKLRTFNIARENLRRAIIVWQQIDNIFEQANGVYALGFLEELAENFDEARSLYKQALELARPLPDTPLVTELRGELEEHLTGLNAETIRPAGSAGRHDP
jgi:tetratricopeptide (TPR) repeat protein